MHSVDGASIYEIDGCGCCFRPVEVPHVLLTHHGVCYLDYLPILSFGDSILLGSVQLLVELKLARGCVRSKNLLEIFPRLFGRLRVSYVAKHVVVYTCCQAIHYAACGLHPCTEITLSLYVGQSNIPDKNKFLM